MFVTAFVGTRFGDDSHAAAAENNSDIMYARAICAYGRVGPYPYRKWRGDTPYQRASGGRLNIAPRSNTVPKTVDVGCSRHVTRLSRPVTQTFVTGIFCFCFLSVTRKMHVGFRLQTYWMLMYKKKTNTEIDMFDDYTPSTVWGVVL